jgi:HEAT repeat protein
MAVELSPDDESRDAEGPDRDDTDNRPGENGQDRESEEKLAYFLEMLKSENVGWRWKAAESLARLGDPRAVDPLIETLRDEDWRVRQKAAWALGYLGDPRAIIPLRRAYRDEREGVREIIMEALDMIKEQMALH